MAADDAAPNEASEEPVPQTPWRPGRLQTRFLAATSLILVLVSSAMVYLFHRLSVDAVEQSRLRAASDVADSLAIRLGAGTPETSRLEQILAEYVHENSEIVAVAVRLDNDGERSAGMRVERWDDIDRARRTESSVSRVVVEDGDRLWIVAAPILRDGTSIGAVGVWSSLRAAELLSREIRRLAVVLLPASTIVLLISMTILFRREVHAPMEALGVAMMRAESGEREAEAPVIKDDEIGFIAERYNQLLANIRQTQAEREQLVEELQRFNELLSSRVKDATAELEDRSENLESLNRELYHLQRRLVRAERQSVAQHMTARVAHKIGTPLNLISGHVQLLRESRPEDAALQRKLDVIETQIDKLTGTIRESLDETRRTAFQMSSTDLKLLLENTKALLAPTLAARGVSMVLELGPGPVVVDADDDRLEQVFLTLINNSLDAMPDGGTITVSSDTTPSGIVVRLSDDGVGIPETLLPRIFTPFVTTKEPGRGTGLGLSIVTEILSAHDATIRAESPADGGASFVLEFPRSAAGAAR